MIVDIGLQMLYTETRNGEKIAGSSSVRIAGFQPEEVRLNSWPPQPITRTNEIADPFIPGDKQEDR